MSADCIKQQSAEMNSQVTTVYVDVCFAVYIEAHADLENELKLAKTAGNGAAFC